MERADERSLFRRGDEPWDALTSESHVRAAETVFEDSDPLPFSGAPIFADRNDFHYNDNAAHPKRDRPDPRRSRQDGRRLGRIHQAGLVSRGPVK